MTREPDVMQLLARSRPASLEPDNDPGHRTRDLEAAFAQPTHPNPPGPATRRAVRAARRTAIGLGGVTAVAAAIALVAPAVVPDSGAGGTPGGSEPGKQQLSARGILLAAAAESAAEPASGRYWHTHFRRVLVDRVGPQPSRYTVESRSETQRWVARSPDVESWAVRHNMGARPRTPADEEVWRAAGSPARVEVAGKAIRLDGEGTEPYANKINEGEDVAALGGENVTLRELRQLPTDAGRLRSVLLEEYRDGDPASGSDLPPDRHAWLFRIGGNLVVDLPVSPEVRSAAYRMLADLPDVRSLGQVTDPLGRKANGVAMTNDTPDNGVLEERLLIDPSTGQARAVVHAVVEPGGRYADERPAAVTGYRAVLAAGWTDESPELPERRLPPGERPQGQLP